MELTQLQYFQMAATMQNITQAARILHISQPTLSRAISNLEDELGVQLFYRIGNRISLNPCGVAFLNRVELALKELESGVKEVHSVMGDTRGTVTIASFTPGLISEPLLAFMSRYPNVKLHHIVDSQSKIKEGLEKGDIDLALTMAPVDSPATIWYPLVKDELIALVSGDNPLYHKKHLDLRDLQNEKVAMTAANCGVRGLLEGFCFSVGFEPDIFYTGEDGDIVMSMLKKNACIFLLLASNHVWKVEEDRRQASKGRNPRPFDFRAIRIKNPACTVQYGITIPKQKIKQETHALFVLLREYLVSWQQRYEAEGLDDLINL